MRHTLQAGYPEYAGKVQFAECRADQNIPELSVILSRRQLLFLLLA